MEEEFDEEKKEFLQNKHLKKVKDKHYEILIDGKPFKILNCIFKRDVLHLISKFKFELEFDKTVSIELEDTIVNGRLRAIACKPGNYKAMYTIIKEENDN